SAWPSTVRRRVCSASNPGSDQGGDRGKSRFGAGGSGRTINLNRARPLILTYVLLSSAFYCSLLPLWEGFDEFYHYGYVQHVSTTWSIPVIWKTPISRELWNSLDFVPVSHFLQPYFQRPTTKFEDYFRLPAEQRIARRQALDTIPSALRREPSPRDNYEAKQSPLSYLLL